MKRLVKGLVQDASEQTKLVKGLVRVLGLAGNLCLADHHGIECRRDSEEVTDRRGAEVDVQMVVVG